MCSYKFLSYGNKTKEPRFSGELMNFKWKNTKDILIIEVLTNRATVEVSGNFKEELIRQIDEGNHKVIVDLIKSEFIDSSFLGALVAGLKRTTMKDGDLKLVGLQPAVQSMFELTRLHRIFEIFENESDAIRSFT
jgi:anti-sigma B factor antagonist